MNLTSPISKGAARAAELPSDSVPAFLKAIADYTGLFADDSSDGVLGILMSGLAGVAAALAVGIFLTVYFRARPRNLRDIVTHGLSVVAVLGLVAFVASDFRHAALGYLGINPTKPAVEFEIRLPNAALSGAAQTQVELHTDRNQTLAKLLDVQRSEAEGLSVLRGLVALKYRTRDRVVILHLPGHAECEFKLRLAASPSRSDQFGPWHLADRVASGTSRQKTRDQQNDAFAIRYRVL